MDRSRKAACILLLMLLPGWVCAAVPSPDFSGDIRSASAKLLDRSGRPDEALSGLRALVDVLGRLAESDTRVSAAVRTKMREASEASRIGNSLEGKVTKPLSDAWTVLSGGSTYVMPAGIRTIEEASAYIRSRVDACLKSLERGDNAHALKELLEAVLASMTPMEVQGFRLIDILPGLWRLVFVA